MFIDTELRMRAYCARRPALLRRMPARRHGAGACSEPRFPGSCLAEGMPAPEAIFRPVVSGEAVAILVLIENSQAMVQNWSDLRDHHLPTLLGTMRLANSIVPVSRQGVDY
jgi:hypothetical protein